MYAAADSQRILELVDELDLNRYNEGPLALIRTIRGKILYRPRSGGIEVWPTAATAGSAGQNSSPSR